MSDLKNTTHLFGANAIFLEELYQQYVENPASVDSSWQEYFKSLNEQRALIESSFVAAPWRPRQNAIIGRKIEEGVKPNTHVAATSNVDDIKRSVAVASLIEAYRALGHLYVEYDPLGLTKPVYNAELDYKTYGLTDDDLDKTVHVGNILAIEKATLRNIISFLQSKYCHRLGVEYMHLENLDERLWMQKKIEGSDNYFSLNREEKKKALFSLLEAELFENYLHTKFPGAKRFSVEGGEGMITSVEFAIKYSVNLGIREVVIGMAHRGRLNTLTKIMGKPYHAMLSEFKGELAFPAHMDIPGDVKYHLGTSTDTEIEGHKVHLSLAPNPSHLEVVNSIVLGKVRAQQDQRKDKERSEVLGVLIHGDAAFAGQGSVPESLYLSQLQAYYTGGTLHIIINNQIGFTTNPSDARSTRYCSDVVKSIAAPILHINGDDAEAIILASKLAAEYRATFKKDIVIDIVCYRKYGHNEGDEPFFTQPIMYKAIAKHEPPHVLYCAQLIAEGVITQEEYDAYKEKFKTLLDNEYAKSQSYQPTMADWLQGKWGGLEPADINRTQEKTGVDIEQLKTFGKALYNYPQDFNINSKIERQLHAKQHMFETGEGFDWATAEALAFASLLHNGYNIRMTGQDVRRGTFSHRHAVLFDQENEKPYTPLNNLSPDQKHFLEIYNSNLSEFGVLAFEYGYSFTEPHTLTLWEAQFGDFVNGAQVIIDQYIASGEAKWLRMNGLVMLLPHGYEGQGPEHSSARLERFLQLCAKDNMQVVNCSTPASYFHVLRRQLCRNFRKPLIVMSPKSLLRHKLAVSALKEMGKDQTFMPVIDEVLPSITADKVKKLIICSGKIYYDLYEKRNELKRDDVALIRLEEYYPFPKKLLANTLSKYNRAQIFWLQEEHENMGAFYFVEPRIEKVLLEIQHPCNRAKYIGRPCSAAPAVGYMKMHQAEHKKLLEEAFS